MKTLKTIICIFCVTLFTNNFFMVCTNSGNKNCSHKSEADYLVKENAIISTMLATLLHSLLCSQDNFIVIYPRQRVSSNPIPIYSLVLVKCCNNLSRLSNRPSLPFFQLHCCGGSSAGGHYQEFLEFHWILFHEYQ